MRPSTEAGLYVMKANTRAKNRSLPAARKAVAAVAKTAAVTISAEADPFDLGGLEEATGYALRRAQLAIFTDFARRFAELDLKPAQYSALLLIAANPGQTQSAIGAALGILRPNFVAMLDELERRGLARRTRSEIDRRSHAVVLTPAGDDILARARAIQRAQEDRIRDILGADGREALIELSTLLWRALQES
jgi:DNA-binding MarR family transcriptional regulator